MNNNCQNGLCYKTSDNKNFGCPAKMSDGRHFTDYRPDCYVNNLMYEIFKYAEFNPIVIILNNALKQINTITWIIFLISISTRYIRSNNSGLKWFVELSYPVYILHLAPVTIISAELYILGLNQISIFILSMLIGEIL